MTALAALAGLTETEREALAPAVAAIRATDAALDHLAAVRLRIRRETGHEIADHLRPALRVALDEFERGALARMSAEFGHA